MAELGELGQSAGADHLCVVGGIPLQDCEGPQPPSLTVVAYGERLVGMTREPPNLYIILKFSDNPRQLLGSAALLHLDSVSSRTHDARDCSHHLLPTGALDREPFAPAGGKPV